ncbi:MAG: SpoIID/LytB domain-containing protein [Cyanobacteria bacterium P01_A01_bin.123]
MPRTSHVLQRRLQSGLNLLMPIALGIGVATPVVAQAPQNPVIEVGVVQRFGEEATDTLVIEPLTGDRLTVSFETNGQAEAVATNRLTLDMVTVPLAKPALQEQLVLSTHRSFESAEDSANQWRDRGIETEIAQPDGWEVWAKREVYSTPLLRRLLLRNLRGQGLNRVYLDTHVLDAVPKASFVANGYRYNRDRIEINSANQRIRVIAGARQRDRKLYGGTLQLQPNAYGTYTLVNDVPIETYLRGVVPHEIGPSAPRTAIEAQAILARTYALRNLRRFTIDDYELCADTQCQVYWGLGGTATVADQAIAATRGQVLTYEDELVDALYSSTTGGVTARFSDVWNGPDRPYLRSVVDSVQNAWDLNQYPLSDEQNLRAFLALETGFNEEDWELFRWRRESTLAEISRELKEYLNNRQHPLAGFTYMGQLQVIERAPGGRVQRLAIQTDLGTVELEKDEIIRALYGPKSLLFYLDPTYEAAPPVVDGETAPEPVLKGYAFVGGGWGHGVGMSQTGTYHLGELGWPSDRILQFYYPGTVLQPISDRLTFWRDPETSTAQVVDAVD